MAFEYALWVVPKSGKDPIKMGSLGVGKAEFEVKEATQRAQAKIAEAQGLAQAQALQKASLTQEYLQLEAIKKWDGKLPQVVGGGSVPFLNIPLK